MSEHCMIHKINRRYKKCQNQNIHLTVMWKGEEIPICWEHWCKIAEKQEW